MNRICLPIVVLIAGLATPIAAQVPDQPPSNLPENPVEAPRELDMHDTAIEAAKDQDRRRGREAKSDSARPAKPDELVVGAQVSDNAGVAIGAIDAVQADGIVVKTATGKVMVPAEAFGKNKKGLLVNITKQEFDALIQGAAGQPAG